MNLAFIKYYNFHKHKNTPLDKSIITKLTHVNESYYQVNSWLKSNLKSYGDDKSVIYGSCDATGTSKYLNAALWKSYSELIERWAYHYCLANKTVSSGINIDSTTTGFAAYPSYTKKYARNHSYSESIERWAILNWWQGKIGADYFLIDDKENINAIEIKLPSNFGSVIICFTSFIKNDLVNYCYGFAHSQNTKTAINKAKIEMLRNKFALLSNKFEDFDTISDKRLYYFSTINGHKHFLSQINPKINSKLIPDLVFDKKISGDWDNFAIVWRCLLPDISYNWDDTTCFMF